MAIKETIVKEKSRRQDVESATRFRHLISPGRIGKMTVRNRMVMPPMGTNYAADNGFVTERLVRYYEARAEGGTGLIIVEVAAVAPEGKAVSHQVGLWADKFIPGLRYLAESIKKHGARAAIQLHHAGRQTTVRTTGHQMCIRDRTRIIVDRDAAMREGLTVAQVYQQVAAALATETESTTLTAGEAEYPVIVVATDRSEITRDNISDFKLTFNGQDGTEKEVLLGDIAEIVEMSSPLAITRENQSRYVTVTAAIADGYNIGLVSREFEDNLASYTPPPGTSLEVAGENKMINEAMRDIILMIVLAVILIYLVMVAQFQSLLSPLIILFTLPLAFTGGLLLLWVCGLELSVPALLGFLVLAGIVVNNGIVFVDYVNPVSYTHLDVYKRQGKGQGQGKEDDQRR